MVKIRLGELMKQKFFCTILILIILSLSACGSAEPTLNPEDQASTAVAEAWLIITQTQAALPTSTPIPPTNTPEPTLTPPPTIPILPTLPPATVAVAPTQNECNQVPPLEPQGAQVRIEIKNESNGSVNLSLGMNSPNDKKECVTYSFTLSNNNNPVAANVLAGCYWGWGWVDGKEDSIARSGSQLLCMTDANVIYKILVTKERVEFR
jgi:predicted small lipoprotein YifL